MSDNIIHELPTAVSERQVWRLLSSHIGIGRLLADLPEEAADEVRAHAQALNEAFTTIERAAFAVLTEIPLSEPRDRQEQIALAAPHPDIVLAMLDQREYAEQIWQMVQPDGDA